ncbi:MAG: hypothetical protein DRI57_04900 [Deltaproteobacteria bacterium]|nr:MAG: hypothetical protein DRI57_04900 [Deltaproteobacteria bacterium]
MLRCPSFFCQSRQKFVSIYSAIRTMKFIFGNIAANEPITHGKTDIDSPARLCGKFIMYLLNGGNQTVEIHFLFFVYLMFHTLNLLTLPIQDFRFSRVNRPGNKARTAGGIVQIRN